MGLNLQGRWTAGILFMQSYRSILKPNLIHFQLEYDLTIWHHLDEKEVITKVRFYLGATRRGWWCTSNVHLYTKWLKFGEKYDRQRVCPVTLHVYDVWWVQWTCGTFWLNRLCWSGKCRFCNPLLWNLVVMLKKNHSKVLLGSMALLKWHSCFVVVMVNSGQCK